MLSLGLGAYHIPIDVVGKLLLSKLELYSGSVDGSMDDDVLFVVRMRRVLLGGLVDAAWRVRATGTQGIFRNPLADPGLVGISCAASLFAVFVIAFESLLFVGLAQLFGYYLLILGAFVGA